MTDIGAAPTVIAIAISAAVFLLLWLLSFGGGRN